MFTVLNKRVGLGVRGPRPPQNAPVLGRFVGIGTSVLLLGILAACPQFKPPQIDPLGPMLVLLGAGGGGSTGGGGNAGGSGEGDSCGSLPVYTINTINSKAIRNAQFSFSVDVTQCGDADAARDVYFSTNSAISTLDTFAGSVTVNRSQLGTQTFTITVPGSLTLGGTYYVGLITGYQASPNLTTVSNPDATCTAPCNIQLDWTANKETGVNSAGGGYRIYYDTSSLGTANSQNVPYVSGPTAPVTGNISLSTANLWYVRVQAYSSHNSGATASDEKVILAQ